MLTTARRIYGKIMHPQTALHSQWDKGWKNNSQFASLSIRRPTVLSILAMESADSVRSLYRHFLSGITKKSLNAFYYACSYAKADYSGFMNTTAGMALKLIPEKLQSQPVFLCIDDTMISKYGTKFEDVSKLFDHASHNGSNYLNGHCFVSVMLCVPVYNK